jgi:hypothetical protein
VLTLLGACAVEDPVEDAADATTFYADFTKAFDSGADCPELFEIRNRMDPKDPIAETVNEDLRSVECYMSTSSRAE